MSKKLKKSKQTKESKPTSKMEVPVSGEEPKNGVGILPDRDLKKNLGCG